MSKPRTTRQPKPPRWYSGANVPMSVIRRFVRQVVERFHPDKIILFGSYAYGRPHEGSDVDIFIVMPARNALDRGYRIYSALEPPFPAQIVVRTPRQMRDWLADGDPFHIDVATKGITLYEKSNGGRGRKGGTRFSHGRSRSRG